MTLSPALAPFGGPLVVRDTDATPFTSILADLLEAVPGAYAVALVDAEGETVDYTGRGDTFDLRVAAAHLQLVLQGVDRFNALGSTRWITVRGRKKSIAATVLPEGYALTFLLRPRSAFAISTRALHVCMRALAEEAGWKELGEGGGTWFPVSVATDRRGRPVRLGEKGTDVEVLGALVGLSRRERGFRVRTANGSEFMLVREAGQRWYADEAV